VKAREAQAMARSATRADARPIADVLGRAFHDDPLISFMLPDEASRAEKGPRLFGLLFKLGFPHGGCDVSGGYEAAALWRPPGAWHIPAWQYVANGAEFLGLFGLAGARRVTASMDLIEARHPKAPHWYLQAIGTEPGKQGMGYGGLLMRHRLAVADAAQAPCYLESSKDTNIPIYQSFGFQVTGEIVLPEGPTLWPMWREPRAA
jgi:ribosomal protein S18 acetylase RimI-like enzyme